MEIGILEIGVFLLIGMLAKLMIWMASVGNKMEEVSKEKEDKFLTLLTTTVKGVEIKMDTQAASINNQVNAHIVGIKSEIKETVNTVQLTMQNEMLKAMLNVKESVSSTVNDTVKKVRHEVEQTVSHNVDKVMKKVDDTTKQFAGKADVLNWFSENPLMVAFGIAAITSLVIKYSTKNKFKGEAKFSENDSRFERGMKVAALLLDYLIGIGLLVGATVGFISNSKYNALRDLGQMSLSIVGKAKNLMGFFTDKKLDPEGDNNVGIVVNKTKNKVTEEENLRLNRKMQKHLNSFNIVGESGFPTREDVITTFYTYDIQNFLVTFFFPTKFDRMKRPLETEKLPYLSTLVTGYYAMITAVMASFLGDRNYDPAAHKYKVCTNGYAAFKGSKEIFADMLVSCEDPLFINDLAYVLALNTPGMYTKQYERYFVFPFTGIHHDTEYSITLSSDNEENLVPVRINSVSYNRQRHFMTDLWVTGSNPVVDLHVLFKDDGNGQPKTLLGTKYKLVTGNPNLDICPVTTLFGDKSYQKEVLRSAPIDPLVVSKPKLDLMELDVSDKKKRGFGGKLKDIVTTIDIKDPKFWMVVVGGVCLLTIAGVGVGWLCTGGSSNQEKRLKKRGEAKKLKVKERPFYIPNPDLMKHDHYVKKKIFDRETEPCDACNKEIFVPYFRAHISKCKYNDHLLKYFPSSAYYCPNCELNVFDCDWEWHCRECHPDWSGGYFCDEEVNKLKEAGVKDLSKYIHIKAPEINLDFFRGGSMHKKILQLCITDIEKPLGKTANKSSDDLLKIAAGKFHVVPLNNQIKMDSQSEVIYNVNSGIIGYVDPFSDALVVQKPVDGDYLSTPRPSAIVETKEGESKKVEKKVQFTKVGKEQVKVYKPTGRTKEQVSVAKTTSGKDIKVIHEPGTPKMTFTCRSCKKLLPFVEREEKQKAWDHLKQCRESKSIEKKKKEKPLSPNMQIHYGESKFENLKVCKHCGANIKTSRQESHLEKCVVLGKKQEGEGQRPWNTYVGHDERGSGYGRHGGGVKRKNRLAGYSNAALGITPSRNQEMRMANAKRAARAKTSNTGSLSNLGKMLRWDWYQVDPNTEFSEEELERKENLREALAIEARKQKWSESQFRNYARELDDYIFSAKMALQPIEDFSDGESGSDKEIPCRLCMVNDGGPEPHIVLVKRSKMRQHNRDVHKTNGPFKHFKGKGEVNIFTNEQLDSAGVLGECVLFDHYEPYFYDDFKPIENKIGESVTPDCGQFNMAKARKHMIEITYVEIDTPRHHAWGFRSNNLFYLGGHVLAKADKEKIFVNLPGKTVPFNNFVKRTFAVVQDNVLYEVNQEYKTEFEKVASTKFTMPDDPDLSYKQIFTGEEIGHFVAEMTPNRILTPGNGDSKYFVTCALYSSKPGDSGSLIWAYNRRNTSWVPIGVHFGDQGSKRLFYTFFSPNPTQTNLN